MQQITLNVTNLVQIVKEKNILFYPAIIHILLQTCSVKEEVVFYELEQQFFKTHFYPDFNVFYKNYLYDYCFKKPQPDISNGIVFALSEQSIQNADFIVYPLCQQQNQTFLKLKLNFDVDSDFEARCQKAVLNFGNNF